MSDSRADPKPIARRRRRRLFRLSVRLMMGLVVLASVGIWLVTRSWFIVSQVTPDLERRLGGPVEIERATYDLVGRLVLHGLTLRSPTHDGDAGEVLKIGRAVVVLDPLALLQPKPSVRGVELTDLRLRLAESRDAPGEYTFMALRPDFQARREEEWPLPPYVTILNGAIEVGLHADDRFEMAGRRLVRGSMAPIVSDERAFVFSLEEIGAADGTEDAGLSIDGQWTVTTNATEARLHGLALDARAHAMCPTWARVWWDRLGLAGKVASASLGWDGGTDLSVQLDLEDVELTLPIDSSELWAQYTDGQVRPAEGRPRMHVQTGAIRLDRNGVSFEELVGEIRGSGPEMSSVPYQVAFRMPQLPELDWSDRVDWGERVLEETPFEMTVRLEQFTPTRDESGAMSAVELPLAVARFFDIFNITDWQLSTELTIARRAGEPTIDSRGQVYIHNAAGAYDKFPYPLEDVEAYLHFDREQVIIEYLNGRGSGGAPVRISGRIAPPGPGASITLRMSADDIPLDERFQAALGPKPAAVFDMLVHDPSLQELAEAGLLADEASVSTAAGERERLLVELAQRRLRGSPREDQDRVRRRIEQLDRIIDAGPFVAGGVVDLELTLEREAGPGRKAVITGLVTVDSVGLAYRGFPYPVTVVDGLLDWRRDRVAIVSTPASPGLLVVTPGGGLGVITGEVGLRRADQPAPATRLDIVVVEDRLSPQLLAALPGEEDEGTDASETPWSGDARSRTGRVLEAAGVRGDLRYGGSIHVDPDGEMRYSVDVDLLDGEATPDTRLLGLLGLPEGQWPPEWRYRNVAARVELSEQTVVLDSLTGRQEAPGRAELNARGRIDLDRPGKPRQFVVNSRATTLGKSMLDLLPESVREDASAVWKRYRPGGRVDAELRYQSLEPDTPGLELEIAPAGVTLAIDDRPVEVSSSSGRLLLGPTTFRIDALTLEMAEAMRPFGRLRLDGAGSWGEGNPTTIELDGFWTDGRVDCPLSAALLQRFGSTTIGGVDLEHGTFDASFEYDRRDDGSPASYRVSLQPREVHVRRGETRLAASFEPGSNVELTPTRVTFDQVAGRAGESAFRLDGVVDHVGHIDADLRVRYEGSVRGPLAQIALPSGVVEVLDDLKLEDPGDSRVTGRLRMTSIPRSDGGDERRWRSSFDGEVDTRGLSIAAGLDFEEVGGLFVIEAAREPDRPVQLTVTTDAAWGRVLGHPLDRVGARIRLSVDGREVLVEDLRGTLHGGGFSGEARFDLGDRQGYVLAVNLVEVPLQPLLVREDDDEQEQRVAPSARGQVFAGLRLSGDRGEQDSRRGRGLLRVVNGELAGIPLLLQILQVTQLTLPVSGVLDYADVAFFVAGGQMTFERILFESTVGNNAPLQLIGEGQMDLETFELDTRFRSRSGWLVLRDLVGGIGDQLWVIQVTGPLKDPRASVVPLPAITSPSPSYTRPLRPGTPISLQSGGS